MQKTGISRFQSGKVLFDSKKWLLASWGKLLTEQQPTFHRRTTGWRHMGLQISGSQQIHQSFQQRCHYQLSNIRGSMGKMVHGKTWSPCSHSKRSIRLPLVGIQWLDLGTIQWRSLSPDRRILAQAPMVVELVKTFATKNFDFDFILSQFILHVKV